MTGSNVIAPKVRRALEIWSELSGLSIKKYEAVQRSMCQDGRVRGLLKFYGACRTGRWTGRLVQVQNLKKTPDLTSLELDCARELVKKCDLDGFHEFASRHKLGVLELLGGLVRGCFIASAGPVASVNASASVNKTPVLLDCDFSAIEARIVSWLADEEWRLEVFKHDGKIYESAAAKMFNVPVERITPGNPEYELRQKGKVAELALGYQGGVGALEAMGARDYGLKTWELQDLVTRWRSANPKIVKLWTQVLQAATDLARDKQGVLKVRNLVFRYEAKRETGERLKFLTIQLPSGRKLYYKNPEREVADNGWLQLSYDGFDTNTHRWGRRTAGGGKLLENCVQAIARDCLATALGRIEAHPVLRAAGVKTVFHVHDEVICEYPGEVIGREVPCSWVPPEYLLDVIKSCMSEPIAWAPGLQLAADGWINAYYK